MPPQLGLKTKKPTNLTLLHTEKQLARYVLLNLVQYIDNFFQQNSIQI